jgi:hypothetical protein
MHCKYILIIKKGVIFKNKKINTHTLLINTLNLMLKNEIKF